MHEIYIFYTYFHYYYYYSAIDLLTCPVHYICCQVCFAWLGYVWVHLLIYIDFFNVVLLYLYNCVLSPHCFQSILPNDCR